MNWCMPSPHQILITCLFVLLLTASQVAAQQDNRRCLWVSVDSTTISLPKDEYILSESLYLFSNKLTDNQLTSYFTFTQNSTYTIQLTKKANWQQLALDSIAICYRVLPNSFTQKVFNRSEAAYDSGYYSQYNANLPISQGTLKKNVYEREELFSIKGIGTDEELQKTGSLSRGISFGNGSGQDVGVISALNLQLEGKLTPDLTLTAAITDQNVPFQPEGNTQQLQDFDQVLIQLKHKQGALAAGDIVLQNDSSTYFLKYYKNVQGAQLHAHFTDSSTWKSRTSIGVSAAKGQFNSDSISVIEGVQGPYRLRGADGERFITILANSERVFLDGKRLERGFDYDYIIDYNTAEITFTNQVLITQFSRVRVDFEYATQNYSRSILQASHYQTYKKWGLTLSVYREKDNTNSPLLAQLSEADREILTQAGDAPLLAVASAANPTEVFDPNQILYAQREQEVNGVLITYFERVLTDEENLFSVVFSEVGQGNGNYISGDPTANGRVYVWVPPINGIPQGNFEPIRQLPAPNQRQLMTARLEHQLNKKEKLYIETAFSNHDQNLFSQLDGFDNRGKAIKVGYENLGKKSKKWKGYEWMSGLSAEYNEKHFQFIDRFRSIEFDRDWALENRTPADDYIFTGHIGLKKDQDNLFHYQLSHRQRGQAANGLQHQGIINKEIGKLQVQNTFFLLHSAQDSTTAQWSRLHSIVAWRTNPVIFGYDFQLDNNTIRSEEQDSVLRVIMNFRQHQAFIQNGDSLKHKFRVDYTYRTDFLPLNGALAKNTLSRTSNFSYQHKTKTSLTNFTATYRVLEQLQQDDANIEETIMGRLDWNKQFANKRVRSSFSLSTAGGRELKREFFYLPVDVGQGTHTWRDDNQDGIQDLNEFYEAINLEERQYAKFFQPTDEYILAFNTILNYQLHLQSPKKWQKGKGLKKIISQFSSITSIRVNKRTTDNNPFKRLSPFVANIAPADLLSYRNSIRSSLFYKRRNPKFGAEFLFLNTGNKQLLTTGFQESTLNEFTLNLRRNFNKKWSGELTLSQEHKSNDSDVLNRQNFDIHTYRFLPQLSFQPNKSLRFTGEFSYRNKLNTIGNREQAQINELALSIRLAKQVRNALNLRIQYVHIGFEGEANTSVGYELLEALQPGTNIRWEFRWSQRLNNGLQLTAIYNGRKSEANPVIHIGRVQATALF
ncbi:MAG: hypothetical protein ACPGJS_10100 [Flammeovirgaceae bacterium]